MVVIEVIASAIDDMDTFPGLSSNCYAWKTKSCCGSVFRTIGVEDVVRSMSDKSAHSVLRARALCSPRKLRFHELFFQFFICTVIIITLMQFDQINTISHSECTM